MASPGNSVSGPLQGVRLEDGEKVVWQGQPHAHPWIRLADVIAIPGLVLWALVILLVLVYGGRALESATITIVCAMSIAVILYFGPVKLLLDMWQRSRVHYALTNRRVLIGGGILRPIVRTISYVTIDDLSCSTNHHGSGTIRFGSAPLTAGIAHGLPWPDYVASPSFECIPDVENVYTKAVEEYEKATKPFST